MKLVDQVIVEHMFTICKNQVISFVTQVLKEGVDATRDGFFHANLVFTKQGIVSICLMTSIYKTTLSVQKKIV